jgi:hypothetical protein
METDLISYLFSPFEKQVYCNYFLILEILYFIVFFILLFTIIYLGITYNEGAKFYFDKSFLLLIYIISYFQSRLLYSMCIHSI